MKNLLLLLVLFFGLNSTTEAQTKKTIKKIIPKDVVANNVDLTAKPGDDFFQFANGGWLKAHPIPPSESSWGIGRVLQEDIYAKMRAVSENAAKKNAPKGTVEQKIGDFWSTGMDTMAIEKQGIKPLLPDLNRIDAVKNVSDLTDLVASFQTYMGSPIYSGGASQDEMQSDKYAFYIWQSGLGLGERDYYFNSDDRNAGIRKSYVQHLVNSFKLLGETDMQAQKSSKSVFDIETFLAGGHRRIEDLRDPHANYNKMSVKELYTRAPTLAFGKLFDAYKIHLDSVIVGQPEYLAKADSALTLFSIADWKSYMKWELINTYSPYLGSAFEKEHFNFYGKTLEGRKAEKPRWKRVLDAQERAMGDALGQLFVQAFFSPKAKQRYVDMTEAIRTAFKEQIAGLDWMTDTTKKAAIDKLNRVAKKVGYPDKWKDFSAMQIGKSSYVENIISQSKWWSQYNINKLGKPVDRTEWNMTPQTYNAYYDPSNNEIVLPAAQFMVPGFADDKIDDAVAYGYTAASTIGHEITHGFDDQGRQYNADGNLQMWWLPQDSANFAARAQKLINQFNEFIGVDTMHVRGSATIGENIADLGGIVLGLKAFKKTEQYKSGKSIAGYTPLQRYFMGYALGWMSQQTKERLARQIMTDVHAPANLRVNAPFADVPEFYEAFNIKPSDKMYRQVALRAKIW